MRVVAMSDSFLSQMADVLLEAAESRITIQNSAESYTRGTLQAVDRGWVVIETDAEQYEYVALCQIVRWWQEPEETDDDEPIVITEGELLAELRKVDEELARERRGQR